MFIDASGPLRTFNISEERRVCSLIRRLLFKMYKDQRIRVRWNTCLSDISEISNGVKQGAVLSLILFTDYIDKLLTRLRESGVGCHIDGVFSGAFGYADDIVLLAQSLDALRHMISICEDYAQELIVFNPSKSKLMYYNVSHDNLHVKLCNQDVDIVSKEIYLGNYISENIYDRAIKQTVCAFNAKCNQIISDFSMLDCFSLHKLHTTYCTSSSPPCLVNANQVAHQLLVNGRGNMPSKPKRPVIPETEAGTSMVSPFSADEYRKGVATLKNNKAAGRDDVLVEQLKNLGPNAHKWLRAMLNNCFIDNKIPTIWRQSKIIAILKPGKDSAVPKSYRPISLLCHTYKLYERLILNRIAPTIEKHLIKEQAGFRAGKSCTSQLLNLTQHIEDGYQEGKITGTAFVDLSAAYDTVNHRLLIQKLYNTTQDSALCRVIQNLLSNRRFYVELNNERSRWRLQKNSLPQGSVLSPILFNVYTNDQPIHDGARSFIYADDLCITAQYPTFTEVEDTIDEALSELTQYYRNNSLRANPDKTQVTAFHLRNREAKRSLNIAWNGVDLENTAYPKYLGVTLDRTLNYKQHILNTKMKVATRNNLLKKLANSKWGTNARTIRTTALALCYSTAEYAAPVWARSSHANKLNPVLNQSCRSITGCLKPTNVEDLYLIAGIAPPDIRREVCARVERTKQTKDERHSLFGHTPAPVHLKSRQPFLPNVQPMDFSAKTVRCANWRARLREKSHIDVGLPTEDLAKGHNSPWLTWRSLNRLRTGYTCSKEQRKKWKYYDGDTTCVCGLATENTAHLLQCPLLTRPCTLDDLLEFNDTGRECAERWKKTV